MDFIKNVCDIQPQFTLVLDLLHRNILLYFQTVSMPQTVSYMLKRKQQTIISLKKIIL